jgi:hypothetical protein
MFIHYITLKYIASLQILVYIRGSKVITKKYIHIYVEYLDRTTYLMCAPC